MASLPSLCRAHRVRRIRTHDTVWDDPRRETGRYGTQASDRNNNETLIIQRSLLHTQPPPPSLAAPLVFFCTRQPPYSSPRASSGTR